MTSMENKMIRHNKFVGLIGLGYWGKNIFRNMHELGILHTAYDTNAAVVAEFKTKFPDINYTISFEAMLQNPEVRAIAIATPASTHYELAKKTLISGKDVFLEKPIALKVDEGKELVELAEKQNRILMIGHILQYHPAVIKLKDIISSGALGKIQYIYSNRLNIGKLRTEENILWSFAPHDISVILMLLEEDPISVSAFGGDYLNKGIYDTTMTTLEFKNGVKGHIFVSWLHPYKEQKLVVVGSKAMAVFDDVSEDKLFVYSHKIEWKEGKIPIAHKADYKVIPVEKNEPLKEELKHFADCVMLKKKPKTDGSEGIRVLRVLSLAEESFLTRNEHLQTKVQIKNCFIHESSFVDDGAEIGEGTKIWHFSHILKGSRIGRNCVVGQNVTIGPDVTVGDKCKIQNNVSLYKGVTLEEGVFCGPSCVFTNVFNPRAFIERKHEFRRTLVKKGATIGANSTIICGNTIGRYALIGAGAVVTKNIPDFAIAAGVPAKITGWVCECGVKLEFKRGRTNCSECGKTYSKKINTVLRVEKKSEL